MADNYLLAKGENGYMVKLKLVDLGDGTFGFPVKISGCKSEKESAQYIEEATTVKEFIRAAEAEQIEIYLESGAIRVRADGEPCTATTGVPVLLVGGGVAFEVPSVSVYFMVNSTITVVSR